MLTEIYIEALLVDEELADQVWQAWIVGDLNDLDAFLTWTVIASYSKIDQSYRFRTQGLR